MTTFLAITTTLTSIFSLLAAIAAVVLHVRVQHLTVSIDGRMDQLLATTHATGVAEGVAASLPTDVAESIKEATNGNS